MTMDDIAPKLQPIEVILQMPEPSWLTQLGPFIALVGSFLVFCAALRSVSVAKKAIDTNVSLNEGNKDHQIKMLKDQHLNSLELAKENHTRAMQLAQDNHLRALELDVKKIKAQKLEEMHIILKEITTWVKDFLNHRFAKGALSNEFSPAPLPLDIRKIRMLVNIYFPNLQGLFDDFTKQIVVLTELPEKITKVVKQNSNTLSLRPEMLETCTIQELFMLHDNNIDKIENSLKPTKEEFAHFIKLHKHTFDALERESEKLTFNNFVEEKPN